MPIAPGSHLGPYEIVAPIGAGGMGEVWKAKDSRIGRDVAIKVLPSEVLRDRDRLERFEKEARAAGGLNHPNLLTIYDAGEDDGVPYIVMELLEGETLQERLATSPDSHSSAKISVRRAVEWASQMASGLAAAHDAGIVHRDLKPANIFITRDGRVKILDFGLAKIQQSDADPDEATLAKQTDPGVVLGTVAYMSPEQLRGQRVDHRSDIFSLGMLLVHGLGGRRSGGSRRRTERNERRQRCRQRGPGRRLADRGGDSALQRGGSSHHGRRRWQRGGRLRRRPAAPEPSRSGSRRRSSGALAHARIRDRPATGLLPRRIARDLLVEYDGELDRRR